LLDAEELKLRREYWMHVHACLVQLHKLPEKEATAIVADYIKRFPLRSQVTHIALIYHWAPFDLACEATGRNLSVAEFSDQYADILNGKTPGSKNGNGRKKTQLLPLDKRASHSTVNEAAPTQIGLANRSAAIKGTAKKSPVSSKKTGSGTTSSDSSASKKIR
jgi:hypothetical protein